MICQEVVTPQTQIEQLIITPEIQLYLCPSNFRAEPLAVAFQIAAQKQRVLIVQPLKGGINQGPHHPQNFVESLDWFRADLIDRLQEKPNSEQEKAILDIWKIGHRALKTEDYRLIVVDGIDKLVEWGIVSLAEVLLAISQSSARVDLLLIGESMPDELLAIATKVVTIRVH